MTSKTQTLRFLILSDTHGQDFFDNLEDEPHWMKGNMPKADVVLHCGDLTNRGSIPDDAAAISMLSAFNAELKLVIAGNHDISLDKDASTRPEMLQTHRKVINMWTGHVAKAANIHYLTEGFRKWALRYHRFLKHADCLKIPSLWKMIPLSPFTHPHIRPNSTTEHLAIRVATIVLVLYRIPGTEQRVIHLPTSS